MTDIEREKLTDPLDRASQLEMETTEGLLREVQARSKRTQEVRSDGSYEIEECVECGEEITRGRLDAAIKNTICIHCATFAERRR